MNNPITTTTGVVMLILSGLSLFGIISQEQSADIGQYVVTIVEAIVGLIAIFKAGDKGGV